MNNLVKHFLILLVAFALSFLSFFTPHIFVLAVLWAVYASWQGLKETRLSLSEYLSAAFTAGNYAAGVVCLTILVMMILISPHSFQTTMKIMNVSDGWVILTMILINILRWALTGPAALNSYNSYVLWRFGEKAKKKRDTTHLEQSNGVKQQVLDVDTDSRLALTK